MILRVSLVANVPLPVEKFAICPIVTPDVALNMADAFTSVNAPDAVNVCSTVLLLVPALCDAVVASALCRPLVAISPPKVVSVAAGVSVLSVEAT